MSQIIRHLSGMLPYMMLVMPVHMIVRLTVLKLRNLKINRYHETALLLFVVFIAGLASQTVIPPVRITQNGLLIDISGEHKTAMIPFRVFCYMLRDLVVLHSAKSFMIDFIGNIIMFVPIGFCVPLLWRASGKATIAAGFFTSLLIEITQLFLPRWTDIDDLILNTTGTLLGWLLYRMLDMRHTVFLSRFRLDCKGANNMKHKKNIIALIIAIVAGFALAMLAMSVAIYFGYTEAYAGSAESLNVSLFGLDIYTLTKAGEQYNGSSIGQNMGIICAGFMAVAVLMEQFIIRAVNRKK